MASQDTATWKGSIIFEPYQALFKAYNNETHVLGDLSQPVVGQRLLKKREDQTQALLLDPHNPQKWINRAATHLMMQFPELGASDALKAWMLLKEPRTLGNRALLKSKAALLLCQALFYTQSFADCLTHIRNLRKDSNSGEIRLDPGYLSSLRKVRRYILQCMNGKQVFSQNGHSFPEEGLDAENITYGKIYAGGYPWLEELHRSRNQYTREELGAGLYFLSNDSVVIRPSSILQDNCYGLYAGRSLCKGEQLFEEKASLAASDQVSRECCRFCCVRLESQPTLFATTQGYCSNECRELFKSTYGGVISFDRERKIMEMLEGLVGHKDDEKHRRRVLAEERLRYRLFSAMIQQQIQDPFLLGFPLSTNPISQLVGYETCPRIVDFSIWLDVELPLRSLSMLQVDIFRDMRFDTYVLLTIAGRMMLNTWEEDQELENGSKTAVTGINPSYSFFNHSCAPNVDWYRDDETGKIVVKALRDIRDGEELFVSYLNEDLLKEPAAQRLEKLKNWMGERPHYCTRCYPKRDGISHDSKHNVEIRSSSRKHTRSSMIEQDTFASLPADYDSSEEYL